MLETRRADGAKSAALRGRAGEILLAVLLFGAFFLPSRAGAQEREVQDTPKRYRELLKDPRLRAALRGEEAPPSGEAPAGRRGKTPPPRREGAGRGGKAGSVSKEPLRPPSRLKLPPPRMPRPKVRRAGAGAPGGGGGSREGTPAGLPPMGDDSLWPWDPSLVEGSPGKVPKGGIGRGGTSPGKPAGRGSLREKDGGGPRPAPPAGHTLFGGEDEPGLFLEVGPVEEPRAGREEEIPAAVRAGRGAYFPAPAAQEGAVRQEGEGPPPQPALSGREEAAPVRKSRASLPAAARRSLTAPLLPERPRSVAPPAPPAQETRRSGTGDGKAGGGKGRAGRGEGPEAARRYLDRMFLALGGRKAFRALGGIHASIRITAYDRMGAEVFSWSAEQETLAGPVPGDRLDFRDGPVYGRRGDAFWVSWRGVERPDMARRAKEELRVLSFLFRFPFSLEEPRAFVPVDARRVKRGGAEEIEVVLEGRGEKAVLRLEPTTCVPREMIYAPRGGREVKVLFSEWQNFKGLVLPFRKALLSPDGRRVSLEIRTLQMLAGFRWGAEHFLPSGEKG